MISSIVLEDLVSVVILKIQSDRTRIFEPGGIFVSTGNICKVGPKYREKVVNLMQ